MCKFSTISLQVAVLLSPPRASVTVTHARFCKHPPHFAPVSVSILSLHHISWVVTLPTDGFWFLKYVSYSSWYRVAFAIIEQRKGWRSKPLLPSPLNPVFFILYAPESAQPENRRQRIFKLIMKEAIQVRLIDRMLRHFTNNCLF